MPAPYLIVDAHQDIAHNALTLGRDPRLSVNQTRALEKGMPARETATVGLPDLLAGNIRIVFGTLYASPANGSPSAKTYETAAEAEALAQEQLALYAMLAGDPRISLITQRVDLDRVLRSPEPRLGIVLLMEGADPIIEPRDAAKWYEGGVRIIGPAWSETRYSGGTGKPGPLTPLGVELMREMAWAGFILDTSHMADEAFFQALDLFNGAVIASHSNVRALVPTDRQLSDEMIRALIARDGVIGAAWYNQFIRHEWRESGGKKEDVSFTHLIDHIKHICAMAGNARHCGIGSDFDGGFGLDATPKEIDTVADLQKFGSALADAGFSDMDIQGILSGNWLRILQRALP